LSNTLGWNQLTNCGKTTCVSYWAFTGTRGINIVDDQFVTYPPTARGGGPLYVVDSDQAYHPTNLVVETPACGGTAFIYETSDGTGFRRGESNCTGPVYYVADR
jgi:hypothetical protein